MPQVSAGTAVLALLIVQLYILPPEHIFALSSAVISVDLPLSQEHEEPSVKGSNPEGSTPKESSAEKEAAEHGPAETDWGLVAVLALGSLGSNTAMASLLTCQAPSLHHLQPSHRPLPQPQP